MKYSFKVCCLSHPLFVVVFPLLCAEVQRECSCTDLKLFSLQFSNLCGAVYRQGNVAFTKDGSGVLSPVGNRVSHFDLKKLVNGSIFFAFLLSRLR